MRRVRTLLVVGVLFSGCGGGGSAPALAIEQHENLGILRADVPTEFTVLVPNPLATEATVSETLPPGPPFLYAPGLAFGDVAANDSFEVRLVFTPTAAGTFTTEIDLRSDTRDVHVTVEATAEDARVEADAVDFGEVVEGDESMLPVTVRNPNAATPFDPGAADPLPAGFSIAGLPRALAPGESVSLPLTYVASAVAAHDFHLRIATSLGAVDVHVTATTTWGRAYTDFGNVALQGGLTPWLEIDVPAEGVSLTIEALVQAAGHVALAAFEGPAGYVYTIDHAVPGSLPWTASNVFALMVPSSDRTPVQLVEGGGTYRFRLSHNTPAPTISVRAIVQTRPGGVVAAGVLDLNVFVAPGLGVADPASDTKLQAMLAFTDLILGEQGLRLGKVSYFPIDAIYDEVTYVEYEDLYKVSAVAPDTRLNVFFVREVPGGYAGIAGQVGGPARNGTRASGVMVDFDPFGPKEAGRTLAHEIGHYLGLTHTVEAFGGHDQIDDTLECPASGTDSVCTEEGAGYLMHWLYLGGDRYVITDGQARVILGHPLVRPSPPAAPSASLAALSSWDPGVAPPSGGLCGTSR